MLEACFRILAAQFINGLFLRSTLRRKCFSKEAGNAALSENASSRDGGVVACISCPIRGGCPLEMEFVFLSREISDRRLRF